MECVSGFIISYEGSIWESVRCSSTRIWNVFLACKYLLLEEKKIEPKGDSRFFIELLRGRIKLNSLTICSTGRKIEVLHETSERVHSLTVNNTGGKLKILYRIVEREGKQEDPFTVYRTRRENRDSIWNF